MSWGAVAAVGATVVGSMVSSNAQKKAGNRAADAQVQAAEIAAEEQRRQFDRYQELLNPFVNAGTGALTGQQNLLGLNGMQAQQDAISGISNSAEFKTYLDQGQNAILQNASATGGLRGGNTQSALSQFAPQLLNQMINQRFNNLGGLTALGQNAAAGVGNAGMQSAGNIGNLMQQSGAAQAGNALAQGKANAQMWGDITGALSNFAGKKF